MKTNLFSRKARMMKPFVIMLVGIVIVATMVIPAYAGAGQPPPPPSDDTPIEPPAPEDPGELVCRWEPSLICNADGCRVYSKFVCEYEN